MQDRPLRPFEQGAHLHVLEWAHDTARARFLSAGKAQVSAAAAAIIDAPLDASPPRLPALEASLHGELHRLYRLGHGTVTSELHHQASSLPLPVGLSAAPSPPNLRAAKGKKRRCDTCHMFDHHQTVCWGYGNHPVQAAEVCDSWAPESAAKTLAVSSPPGEPSGLGTRALLAAQDVAHRIHQAIIRGRLQGIADPVALKDLGVAAGNGALKAAASSHAGGAINLGRRRAALRAGVVGGRLTSVLDTNTCAPCAADDTGDLLPVGDPGLTVPNPHCLGGDRCRCIVVWQLASEVQSQPVAAGR